MRDRESRFKSLILGQGLSLATALAGLIMLWSRHDSWIAMALAAAISALMVYEIRARALYKGPNFPFAGLFMLMLAAITPGITGMLLATVAAGAMTLLFLCFSRPGETRTIFLIYLFCGLGALGSRSFALLAVALFPAMILVRAFSMRGLVAAMLGMLTPAIIAVGFGVYDPHSLVDIYAAPWVAGFDAPTMMAGATALLFGLAMFLPSYGYPAKARARNMAILGLTACAVAMPMADSANSFNYLPLVSLCAAYNVSHLAATRRLGWFWAIAVGAAAVLFYSMYR